MGRDTIRRCGGLLALTLALTSTLGLGAAQVGAETHTYTIDRAHSSVGFEVRHFFNPVPGRFTRFDGKVDYDPDDPTVSKVHLVIEMDSVDTGLEPRDRHLRSADFFDVENYPQASFRSKKVRRGADGTLKVDGELTLRGVTRELTAEVEVLGFMELGPEVAKGGFSARFAIDRKDFGVSWNRALDHGGAVLGDEVSIRIVLQVDRAPAGGPGPAAAPAGPAGDDAPGDADSGAASKP